MQLNRIKLCKYLAVGITANLMIFGSIAQAEIFGSDSIWVGRETVVHGPSQSTELLLSSGGCEEPVVVEVQTTDHSGLVTHEFLHVTQQFGGTIYPLPASYGPTDRSQSGVQLRIEPGPCAKALQATLTTVNSDGTTAAEAPVPLFTPTAFEGGSSGTHLDVDVDSQGSFFDVRPTRVGPGEMFEIGFWNACEEEISAEVELRTIGEEELKVISLHVDIAPSAFARVDYSVEVDENSTRIVGLGKFSIKNRGAREYVCPPGLGLVNATQSLVDKQGNTTHTSGLPTGKRQHKPVRVTKNK